MKISATLNDIGFVFSTEFAGIWSCIPQLETSICICTLDQLSFKKNFLRVIVQHTNLVDYLKKRGSSDFKQESL